MLNKRLSEQEERGHGYQLNVRGLQMGKDPYVKVELKCEADLSCQTRGFQGERGAWEGEDTDVPVLSEDLLAAVCAV